MTDSCVLGLKIYQLLKRSNNLLENLKWIIKNWSSEKPDIAIESAYRIVKVYTSKISEVKCKIFVVYFMTFRHRILFYHSRNNLIRNVKVKLDLTKQYCYIFTEAMQLVKSNEATKLGMADINYDSKVVFKEGSSLF